MLFAIWIESKDEIRMLPLLSSMMINRYYKLRIEFE